jgi:FG-GAP-like repeat
MIAHPDSIFTPSRLQRIFSSLFFAATLLACLGSLIALPAAWGQALSPMPRPKEPLEKYDNPPAYIFRIETSPAMVSQYGSFTSYQVNVDAGGHNILGDAANEPSIAVDPTNPGRMAIGWRQFNSVTSNFRQAGYGYTTDGGTTWRFPGVLQNNAFRSDPVLNSDSAGNFFYLSLLETFYDDMWRSLNGGQSWTRLGPATGGDKEWFTIDKTNGIGHGFQYQAWSTDGNNYGGRQFSRSTNGGLTWMNPINIPNHPVWGTLDVDANGRLFIGGGDESSRFWCIRSSNAQNAGVTPTFDQVTGVNLGGSIVSDGSINPGGLAGQIFLAVDRSGTATNNNVYMLASVQPTGATNGMDVMFVRSTNGGLSFSAPHRINDDPINHNKWHWFGTLSVAPDGRIDVVWLDTRNAANNTNSQLFYSYSADGGVRWSANVVVSNSFNPFIGYPNQNPKIGDYITIVSDDTGGNVAYAATFNGEEDVYYVRVEPPLPQPTDFNNDGHPDYVLRKATTGQTAIWYLNNNVFISGAYGPTLPAGWGLRGVADFNRDTHPDYAVGNLVTDRTAIWYLLGPTFIGGAYGPTLPSGWELVATADFNGGGKPDYVLYKPTTRQTAIWYLNNNVFISGAYGPTLPAGWELVATADFNGGGRPDYVLYNANTRQTAIWYMNNNVFVSSAYGPTLPAGWSLVATADFNGGGKPDYVLSNANTRQTAIWYMNNNVFVSGAYGPTLPAGWSLVGP